MKRKLLTFTLLAVSVLFLMPSCGGQKKTGEGSVEVVLPFSTPEYQSDKNFIRVKNQGISPDQSTAKKIAMLNCREEIASSAKALIKSVTEQYINQISIGSDQEYAAKFEQKAIESVKMAINNTEIIGEKLFRAKDGRYTYYVAMQMSKESIKDEISKVISKDDRLSLEFDKYMFDKTFDEEMAKMEAQR